MNRHFLNQQVATLRQRLSALQQHLQAAPAAQRTQSRQALEALALALEEVQQLPEVVAAQGTEDTQWQRYENACAKLLPWHHYWTKEEKPLVRDLLALLGTALLDREDVAGAEHYLVRALQLSSSWDVARTRALVEERKGEQAQRAGELTQALTSYQQALAYDPWNQTYAQKIASIQSLYAAEHRRQRWEVARRAARKVALGSALILLIGGGLWVTHQAGEGLQSPTLSHQMPLSPFAGTTVDSVETTGESVEAVGGSAKESSQGLGEERERTAQGTELPKVEEERPQEIQTVIPDRDNRPGKTRGKRYATDVNHPPHIVTALPPAHSLEIAAGDVQRFAVQASDPDKDDRLAYAWFLDGQEVARGPTWEFQAPSTPSEPQYQVKVEVSDRGGGKARVNWNLAVKLPSPLPRIVDAQPHDRKVVLQAGESLEFSVVVAVAGGSGEATQGLSYQWRVDDAPPQTTQTPSFRFVDTTPATHRLTVLALSPEGFKSTPKGWLVEVRPAEVPSPPP